LTTYIGERKQRENKFEIWVKTTQIRNLRTYKDDIIKLGVILIKKTKIKFERMDKFGDLIKLWITLINKIESLIIELISLET